MKNLPAIPKSFFKKEEPVQQVMSERDMMRAFTKKWQDYLNEVYEVMGEEAKQMGYLIDGNYGGSHGMLSNTLQRSRIELKVVL